MNIWEVGWNNVSLKTLKNCLKGETTATTAIAYYNNNTLS